MRIRSQKQIRAEQRATAVWKKHIKKVAAKRKAANIRAKKTRKAQRVA